MTLFDLSSNDIRKFLGEMGRDRVDPEEVEEFLKMIGLKDDKFVQITDFADFLLQNKDQ